MYLVPRKSLSRTGRPLAAAVLALVLFLVFAVSSIDLGPSRGDPFQQPQQAPAGLGL
jgi:hypothetical protein